MNKKVLIALCVVVIVAMAIGIVAFVSLRPQPEPEKYGLRVGWHPSNWTLDDQGFITIYRLVWIDIVNNYPEPVNVSRVELIYLPDETLGLIWIERFTLEPNGTEGNWKQLRSDFSSYWNSEPPSEEQLAFFNLLLEGGNEPIVRIEVETDEAIYIYHPLGDATYVKPTTIEKK